MNREVIRCAQGHELRPIGEGISYCIGGRRYADTGERWLWLREVNPVGAEWRWPSEWSVSTDSRGSYEFRIFDSEYWHPTVHGVPTEEDARVFAMKKIRELIGAPA